jgi:hypothetical protein
MQPSAGIGSFLNKATVELIPVHLQLLPREMMMCPSAMMLTICGTSAQAEQYMYPEPRFQFCFKR